MKPVHRVVALTIDFSPNEDEAMGQFWEKLPGTQPSEVSLLLEGHLVLSFSLLFL